MLSPNSHLGYPWVTLSLHLGYACPNCHVICFCIRIKYFGPFLIAPPPLPRCMVRPMSFCATQFPKVQHHPPMLQEFNVGFHVPFYRGEAGPNIKDQRYWVWYKDTNAVYIYMSPNIQSSVSKVGEPLFQNPPMAVR